MRARLKRIAFGDKGGFAQLAPPLRELVGASCWLLKQTAPVPPCAAVAHTAARHLARSSAGTLPPFSASFRIT
jgi:hypothetical protein